MTMEDKNEKYMRIALEEAMIAAKEDEVPIGCVIVRNNEVIARTHNQKVKSNDATKHAEILSINMATKHIGSWYLDECDMYVTLEPCMMCTGAIINSRVRKVYFATDDPKGGCFISNIKINDIPSLNHYPEYECGLLQDEAAQLLKDFFKNKRKMAKLARKQLNNEE